MQTATPSQFTNVQLELLKTFSHQLPETELLELRKTLALFFAERLINQADAFWDNQNWTNEKVSTLNLK
jgi:hypothetical protein